MSEPTAAPRGVIHDLGYKRYLGTRRPQRTRHRVIARQVLSSSWRGWWRMKLWVVLAGMSVTGMAVAIYVMLFITESPIVQGFGGVQEIEWVDYMVAMSVDAMTALAFIVTLTVVARLVADDTRTGAFEFYFSRPLRPIDYTLGKVLGAIAVVGAIAFCGPVAVALSRVAMSATGEQLTETLHLLPKTIAIGAIAAVAYGAVPLAFGVFTSKRGYAVGGWAAYYLIVGGAAVGGAMAGEQPAVAAINLKAAVMGVAYDLYDIQPMAGQGGEVFPPAWAGVASVVGHVAIAVGLIYWRVRRAEGAGMGGS